MITARATENVYLTDINRKNPQRTYVIKCTLGHSLCWAIPAHSISRTNINEWTLTCICGKLTVSRHTIIHLYWWWSVFQRICFFDPLRRTPMMIIFGLTIEFLIGPAISGILLLNDQKYKGHIMNEKHTYNKVNK